ncbi:6-phosphofructokinase [Sulfurovum lithotrophicum]|uniref:ATP-dependent 6-phosphofructokinase n=1 Tax=Sulfurovum lithotrophicum TaxID=206403 RepID=A0A7U4RQJ0_9BACT|nr:6-phosphofructokinase [Sulfurovum lithotrophicum]AKF24870.1 6-phosphofructokinase [Sulfurovum lithotrophicum]
MKNIAILCSGGDVSGMNAALKRFVDYAFDQGMRPFFVENGYEGLIDNKISAAAYSDVAGIISIGGTKIRTSRSERFKESSYRQIALENLREHGITGLVVLGGDGSFKGMQKLSEECNDIGFIGIPSTIDNDIAGTQYCLGVDTALNAIRVAIDSIRDTASSFGRAFVIEVMGRECGYLALVSALTSGAEMCLIPEVPYNLEVYKEEFLEEKEQGRSYFIAIVSEALKNTEQIVQWFEEEIAIESRMTVLGHIQRGGIPTVHDRLMAFHFVTTAIDALREGIKSTVVCYDDGMFLCKDIKDVAFKKYMIDEDLLALGKEFESPQHKQV